MSSSTRSRLWLTKHTLAIVFFILSFSVISSLLGATHFTYSGTLLWQGVTDFEIRGNVAYCVNPQGIRLLDISNPNVPNELSRLHLDSSPVSISVVEDLLLVIDDQDILSLVEVGPSSVLQLRGTIGTDVWPVSVEVKGSYAYLLDGNPGDGFFLSVIDITNLAHPELVRRVEVGEWGKSMQLWGNRIYAIGGSSDQNRICIFDIADASLPRLIGTTGDLGDLDDFVVRNDTAFVCATNPDLQIWDLKTPSLPTKLGTLVTVSRPARVEVLNNQVLLGNYDNSLRVVSIADPRNPISIALLNNLGGRYGISHSGKAVFTSDGRVFRSMDLTDPAEPLIQMQFGLKDYPRDIDIEDGNLFVAHGEDGLLVFNLSTTSIPIQGATWPTPSCQVGNCGALEISAISGRIYSKFGDDSLRVFEAVGDDSIGLLATLGTPWNGSATGSFNGDTLYFNRGDGSVVIGDFRNPAMPLELSVIRTGNGLVRAIGDGIVAIAAYLSPYHPGLELYDLDADLQANLVHTFDDLPQSCYWENPPGDGGGGFVCQYMSPTSVDIDNSVLGLVNQAAGLMLFNITDPNSPILTFRQYDYPYVSDVGVLEADLRQDLAIISRWRSMELYELSAMSAPTLAQTLHIGDDITDFMFFDDNLYIATSSGIMIFNQDQALDADDEVEGLPINFSLSQNIPNPFNATTKISFHVSRPSQVELSVYNITGQRVTTLIDKNLPSGNHSISWDGCDRFGTPVASGVYLYRLNAGEYQASRKMLLLK